MPRVGFLFNHDQVHQVAHSLPIALALALAAPELSVVVATTNDRLTSEVRRLAGGDLPPSMRLVALDPKPSLSRRAIGALEGLLPAGKLAIYRDNLDFFRSLDALVVAEKTSLLLKTRYGLDRLQMIHTRHGAGDRAVGFNAASRRFDHVLASGQKIVDRLVDEVKLPRSAISVVGYPKFDIVPPRKPLAMQANGRPTVLYNPHVSPHLSSWYAQGRAVLEYFRNSSDYNLIFAPHVMLFQRPIAISIDRLRVAWVGSIDQRLYEARNIHIDLGSPACTDMTYTNAADIYLGDVSSQVYEFLRTPRPCVFLNPHSYNYEEDPNFAYWAAGRVLSDVEELDQALREAVSTHGDFLPAQQRLFGYSFDLTGEPSSVRAARVVREVVSKTALAAE
jgi:hypothetical protein